MNVGLAVHAVPSHPHGFPYPHRSTAISAESAEGNGESAEAGSRSSALSHFDSALSAFKNHGVPYREPSRSRMTGVMLSWSMRAPAARWTRARMAAPEVAAWTTRSGISLSWRVGLPCQEW